MSKAHELVAKAPRLTVAQMKAASLVNAIEFAVFKGEEVNTARNRLMRASGLGAEVWDIVDARLDVIFA